MIVEFLSRIASPLSFAIVVVGFNFLAIAVMLLARGWSTRLGLGSGPPVVSAWATVAGGLCGLLFAFAVATLWTQDRNLGVGLNAEAAALRFTARDVSPRQAPLLQEYIVATLHDWPQLCGGGRFLRSKRALRALEQNVRPKTPQFNDDLLRQMVTLERTQAARIQASTLTVPGELWTALIVLALAVIGVLAIANPEHRAFHTALMLIVGTELGALFWVLTLLELPFCGGAAIDPSIIAHALQLGQ